MGLRLKNSSGNYVELNAPSSIAIDFGLTLPVNDGDASQYLQTDGAGTLSWASVTGLPAQALTLGTAVASTSGTSIDFTSIPSTVKRIRIMFYNVSTNGTVNLMVQLGDSGGIETTGYEDIAVYLNGTSSNAGATAGFQFRNISGMFAGASTNGHVDISLVDASTNKWVATGMVGWYTGDPIMFTAGAKSTSATLDRVRITTSNGTNSFDAGTINIMYDG